MKIPSDFYQFKDEKALIVVSGEEHAELFEASDGEFSHINSISAEKTKYSDKEGTYNAPGGLFRSGGVLDDVNERERNQFLKLLRIRYDELKIRGYDYVALLAPQNALKDVIGCFNVPKNEVNERIRVIKEGNYLKYTPEELLRLLSDALNPLAG
ncbi:MAG: hypothetical protein WC519_02795 [Parcubacteria group bacterium]|jgi:hypothetical protein